MGLIQKVIGKSENSSSENKTGRIAIYDIATAPPRLIKISTETWDELIEKITTTTYRESQLKGSVFPYVVLREVVENLIHADFKEIVVSILHGGSAIRITDQGPGIKDKTKAFEPGFTTATSEMKRFIRGVGSGLPIIKEIMTFSGGQVEIKNNLGSGTVVTLRLSPPQPEKIDPAMDLSQRQINILSLITELGSAGPSDINKELGLSVSTIHRELICLEEKGLLKSDSQGKRLSTSLGLKHLNKAIQVSGGFK